MNRRIIAVLAGFVLGLIAFPIQSKAQDFEKSVHVSAEYNYLYSTHSTKFRGPMVLVDKDLSKHWAVGFGIGYNTCSYHFDNDFDLKNLKFVPIVATVQYTITRSKLFDPYVIAKTGITIMSYDKRPADWDLKRQGKSPDLNPAPYYKKTEAGLYAYVGAGTNVNISQKWQAYVNVGMLGYKMSFNNLDLNPHGVAGNVGLRYKL